MKNCNECWASSRTSELKIIRTIVIGLVFFSIIMFVTALIPELKNSGCSFVSTTDNKVPRKQVVNKTNKAQEDIDTADTAETRAVQNIMSHSVLFR